MEPVFTRADRERRTPAGPISGERVSGHCGAFLDKAAKFTQDARQYVKTHDVPAVAADLKRLVRRYPKASIAVAAALGFLVERVLFRKQ